jgi:hypothetical protein
MIFFFPLYDTTFLITVLVYVYNTVVAERTFHLNYGSTTTFFYNDSDASVTSILYPFSLNTQANKPLNMHACVPKCFHFLCKLN